MRHVLVLGSAALVLALGSSACVRQVWSPPAGYPSLETPDRLERGRSSIGGSIGTGGLGLGADVFGGNVKYRQGLGAVEVQGEGAVAVITEDSKADTFPAILSARVGLKGRLVPDLPHFSWRAGLGFGGSAGGVFGAADLGLTAGYENPYVVPFLSLFGNASLPVTSNDVDITAADDDDTIIDHPVTSFGIGFTLGVGVHIGDSGALLNLGFTRMQLYDIHGENEGLVQMALGLELPL